MKKRVTSAKKLKKKQPKKTTNDKPLLTVEELIENGDQAMQSLDVERAHSQYSAAVALLRGTLELNVALQDGEGDVDSKKLQLVQVLSKLGEAKVSLGDPEGAREDFELAVSWLPPSHRNESSTVLVHHETRASLYLYLGQLSLELDALECYKKGIDELQECIRILLSTEMPKHEDMMAVDDDEVSEELSLTALRRRLVGAYCSIAELYLTDLCYEENAERECETVLVAATQMVIDTDGQPCVDALQALANLRLSQRRSVEACQHMLAAYDKMKKGCEALAALVGLEAVVGEREAASFPASSSSVREASEQLVDVDAADSLPTFEFRCQSVKILLECATSDSEKAKADTLLAGQCAKAAIQVIGSLLAENDEVIEVWYLAGCAFSACDEAEVATHYWTRALEMLRQVKENLQMDDDDEDAEDQLEEVEQQIREITVKMS